MVHPELLIKYIDFCQYKQNIAIHPDNNVNIEIHPIKLLPLCEFLQSNNKKSFLLDTSLKWIQRLLYDTNDHNNIQCIIKDHHVILKIKSNNQYKQILNLFSSESLNQTIIQDNRSFFMYVIGELLDNIYEHSEFSMAWFMIKTDKNVVDLCFLDNGITISKSFSRRGMNFKSDSEAISYAIKGLSSKEDIERGYGLRTSIRALVEGLKGEFFLVSGKGAFFIDNKKPIRYDLADHLALNGTLLNLRCNYPFPNINIYDYIE